MGLDQTLNRAAGLVFWRAGCNNRASKSATPQGLVHGRSYTASVWAKTTKPSGAVRISVYRGGSFDDSHWHSAFHSVAKADGWVLLEWSFPNPIGFDAHDINYYYYGLPDDERLYLTAPALRETPLNLIRSPSFSSDAWTKGNYNHELTYNEIAAPPCTPGAVVLGVTTKCGSGELNCGGHQHRAYVTGYNNPTTAPLVARARYKVALWVKTNKADADGASLVRPYLCRHVSRKRAVVFFVWVFFLISLGGSGAARAEGPHGGASHVRRAKRNRIDRRSRVIERLPL